MRPFKTAFEPSFLKGYQQGCMTFRYRGVRCLKSPIDLALYLSVLWDIKPATIIEIGTHSGGSALYLADAQQSFGLDAHVISIDLEPPTDIDDARIRFLRGDVEALDTCFSANDLFGLPRPWLVIEDSAHTYRGCLSALDFFANHMETGDLLVMEDGVLDELGLSERYQGGPNRAIAEFMQANPDQFELVSAYCDHFGQNATYSPNGFLRKL